MQDPKETSERYNQAVRAIKILDSLKGAIKVPAYKGAPGLLTELDHSNTLELLIATILSAQCTDKRVNMTTPALFKRYKTAAAYASAEEADIEGLIKSINFFRNKAKAIISCTRKIHEEYGGKVPRTMGELTGLSGVGRKTASIVLGTGYGVPAIAVDTHVLRVSARLGFTSSKKPEKVEEELIALLPKERWNEATYLLILHGRRTCKARTPLCDSCNVTALCEYYASIIS